MSTATTGRGAAHRVNELIVTLAHLDLVLDRLGVLGIEPVRDPRRSPALGLALLELTGHAAEPTTAVDGGDSPVDALLDDLRAYFRRDYDGWTPVLGKNREVETVGGAHVISGGGSSAMPASVAGEIDILHGGWGGRSLSEDTYVLPAPEGTPGGRYALDGGLPRPHGTLGRGATVAVCDTRLWDHGELAGAYLATPSALHPSPGPQGLPFTAGHATFITGTILRNAPGAAVLACATLDDRARGTTWQLANDLVECAARGADVINVSAGYFTGDNQPSLAVSTALQRVGPGTVVVASAGNHGEDDHGPRRPLWPAAADDVLAVGAVTATGTPAAFSPDAPWVDLLAPGVNVVSNYFGPGVTITDPADARSSRTYQGVAAWSGTSFASAWVSGLIAARIRRGETDAPTALRRLLHDARHGATSALLPKHRD
ncbi:hypothetical protein GCM10010435_34170 [Winogradskya consettensis]|uniref:Peptidase S8/S53 domain-containing protein n=1 Tax=Winogradskya consettensis TaxID=113560 RepID=A0A919SDR5_9ACTN|nr:S8/S53 family peptidase [Actinoplanes consettensis]GIM69874.1 hypothetical protein Aco04nite_17320 [Actinoplanes consettensis]